jgi:hypothetical protein
VVLECLFCGFGTCFVVRGVIGVCLNHFFYNKGTL